MINKLKAFLTANGYHNEVKVKDIPSTCCTKAEIKGLDFDKIKDDFSKVIGVGSKLKSVDFLFFPKKPDEIYFVEMKNFKTHHAKTGEACHLFVEKQFKGFYLPNKIIDSIFIILGILGYHDASKDLFPFFLDNTKLKIKTVLLMDLNSMDMSDLIFRTLDKQKISLTKRIEGEIGILSCEKFIQEFS